MELTHTFTVPTPIEETWAHFQDVAGLASCFPGASLTSVEGDSFQGSCKVKLGPIALVYNGSGSFVEKDDDAHRFVVEAKGKDKRGNGTAGATVTLSMNEVSEGTSVEVLSDLAITGKPAQFGRGVMQDVSDALLARFVDCLESRLSASPEPSGAVAPAPDGTGPVPDPVPRSGLDPAPDPAPAREPQPRAEDDALNLGAAVLPVLLRTYGKQVAGAGLLLALVWWLVRRRR